jgi:hypothetical protein
MLCNGAIKSQAIAAEDINNAAKDIVEHTPPGETAEHLLHTTEDAWNVTASARGWIADRARDFWKENGGTICKRLPIRWSSLAYLCGVRIRRNSLRSYDWGNWGPICFSGWRFPRWNSRMWKWSRHRNESRIMRPVQAQGLTPHMQMSTIHIERSSHGWVDRVRAYDVVIDDEPRGTLTRGRRAEISIEPGEHVVYLRIDWCRSRTFKVNLQPGDRANFCCRPRSLLTALYGITFGRKNYIQLELT